MKHLALECKSYQTAGAATAGTSAINGAVIDRANFESVRFTALLGDVTATCVLGLKLQSGDLSDGSDMADVSGAAVAYTAGASDADSKLLVLDVFKPTKRYVRCVLTRTTANAVVNGILADLYHARREPVTGGDVIASAVKQG
jgi:hypothetical protein